MFLTQFSMVFHRSVLDPKNAPPPCSFVHTYYGKKDSGDMANKTAVLTSLRELDALRTDPNTTWIREQGSNVDVLASNTGSDQPLAICHLDAIQPFTYGDSIAQFIAFEDLAAVALAAHHLNTGDSRLVPELEGLPSRCNVRFTIESGDTQYTPSVGVDHVLNITNRQPGVERLPCAFIGAYRSAVSIATSIFTGLRKLPQISAGSTSADLEDKFQYPLFGRTIPSDRGNAVPIIQFMHEVLKINHLAVLNINDAYGNSFVQGLRMAAEEHAPEMMIHQVSIDEQITSIRTALNSIKATKYQYIFAILFTPETHDEIMTIAHEIGIAGTGHHQWIFADSFDKITGRKMKVNSPIQLAYQGTSMLDATGGIPGIGLVGYETLLESLREINNPEDMEYLYKVGPHYGGNKIYEESFAAFPDYYMDTFDSVQIPFIYEATIALGLAACGAVEDNLFLDGEKHYKTLVNSQFGGINGAVVFDPNTGTKDPQHTLYKVTNFFHQPTSEEGMVEYTEAVTHIYRDGKWTERTPFIFNDGSTQAPPGIPPADIQDNTVHQAVRISVLVLCGLVLMLGVGLMTWTQRNRKTRVVLASQPFFLHIICMGAMVMACTIIPLSIDHGVVSLEGASIACVSVPWLGTMGFSMTLSALFTKTHRINIILNKSNRMQRIKVTIWDVAKPMIFLLTVNTVVLSVMSALVPPEYEMVVESEDLFGRPEEVRGQCDFSDSYAYIGTVCLVNLAALFFTIVQAVKAQNLSMEFAESAQIFRAVVAITMVLFVGVPVLLLSRDNANTFVFVASAIIFVASTSIQLLLFLPKIKFWMEAKKKDAERRLHISGIDFSVGGMNSIQTDCYDDDDDTESTEEFTGMKILTTKSPEELVREVEVLKRMLRQARMSKATSRRELDVRNAQDVQGTSSAQARFQKSSEMSEPPSDETMSLDQEKKPTTSEQAMEPTVESSDHGSLTRSMRDDDSATLGSNERLGSLREKKEVAKIRFESLKADMGVLTTP